MSKLKFIIVEDLMPLYIEDLLSEETKKEIELHLDECEDCKEVYDLSLIHICKDIWRYIYEGL